MFSLVTEHFSLNRILFLTVGLWPYQRSKFARFQIILIFSILVSFIVFQFTTFITTEFSASFFINVISSILCFICFLFNYTSLCINAESTKDLLEKLQHICNELKDENEICIIEEYADSAKRFTNGMTRKAIVLTFLFIFIVYFELMLNVFATKIFLICMIVPFFMEPFMPQIIGIFLFINDTRQYRKMHVLTEYFIDQEKYFYFISLHMSTSISLGLTITTAIGTLLIGCIKHACGIFKIASYRIEQAMTINIRKNISLENEVIIYKKLVYAIDIHRKAMGFAEFLISSFEGTFFFLIVIAVACLSFNLYGLMLSFENNIEELIPPLVRVSAFLIYMFLGNNAGQEITDHNDYVFYTVYNVQWYTAPLHIQKLILFMLQKGTKPYYLNVGGFFAASLECFATLTSVSISYFTVIYSTQK